MTQQADERVTLALTHPSDAHWPFAFHAEQTFALSDTSLRVTLQWSNIDARETAGRPGLAPVLRAPRAQPRAPGTHAPLGGRRRQAADAPRRAERLDADVAMLDLDNCFDGWRGPARIRDEKLSLRLTSSLPHVVVYTPPERDYFCVEPVSHVSNAIRSDDPIGQGLIALGSGETTQAWMQLDVART